MFRFDSAFSSLPNYLQIEFQILYIIEEFELLSFFNSKYFECIETVSKPKPLLNTHHILNKFLVVFKLRKTVIILKHLYKTQNKLFVK